MAHDLSVLTVSFTPHPHSYYIIIYITVIQYSIGIIYIFFYHVFFNKCIFVQFIHLHGQTVPITNTAEKQHDIVLIGDDAVAQSISHIFSREGKKL